MATVGDTATWLRTRLASKIGITLPEVWREELWTNSSVFIVTEGTQIYFPWDEQGNPSGVALEDISAGSTGKISRRIQPVKAIDADEIMLKDVVHPNGLRETHRIKVDVLAEILAPGLPAAIKVLLPDAAYQNLVSHATPHGHAEFLADWRAAGLI